MIIGRLMTTASWVPPVTVCRVYRCSEAGSIIAGLEAAGIPVFAGDFHTLSILQHYAIALGGIQIQVFPQDVPVASEWLADVFGSQTSGTNFKSALLALVVCFVCFVAPPPAGVFVSRPKALLENTVANNT